MLAATVRVTRDLDLAEECVQDAYVSALTAWDRDGVPDRPGAWLTTAARNRALTALAREQTLRSKLPLLIEPEGEPVRDERLSLVFTCCHPALSAEARIALTLRLVCGVSTADVAAAFLVPEPTMAARITRAKKKIAAARIPYRVPGAAELPARLDDVLTVVHLLATTGHTAPSCDTLVRADLADRAPDLARMLHALLPDESEAAAVVALLLVHKRLAALEPLEAPLANYHYLPAAKADFLCRLGRDAEARAAYAAALALATNPVERAFLEGELT